MALTTDVKSLAKHGWFMREGDAFTLPAPGTCGVDSKPDGDDPAYIDVGAIEEWEWKVDGGTKHEVWRPSPGKLHLKDVIVVKEKMTLSFTTGEISAFAVEGLLRTSQDMDSSSTQFNPMSGNPRKGWFHTQLYDHEDTLVVTMDVWGELTCTGGLKSGTDASIVRPTWELLVLYSQYNTGTL